MIPDASAADFLPLDDSDSSDGQASPGNSHNGDDSASDVPMDETDDEDNAYPSTLQQQPTQLDAATALLNNTPGGLEESPTKKRKSPEDASDSGYQPNTLESVKKVKLDESRGQPQDQDEPLADWSSLPAEMWHHIFTYCPPRTLGKLLLVNRLFNVYLDPSSSAQCTRPDPLCESESALSVLKPNVIWQASRRRFWPSMPSPLQDKSELYMWQLSCSTSCQHCGKSVVPHQKDTSDPWQSGPGKDGVAIIWAFATRSCGACLFSKSTKVCSALQNGENPTLVLI